MRLRVIVDRIFIVAVTIISVTALIPLFSILASVLIRGGRVVVSAGTTFFTEIPAPPGATSVGGIAPSIVGSLYIGLLSTLIGIPLALFTGILLAEFREKRVVSWIRGFVNSLLEIPTIMVGMVLYILLVVPLKQFSLLAGSMAVSIVILPYVTTYVERALRNVPYTYREASYSIGLTRAKTVFFVLLGIARRGVLAGVLIGLAKAFGETAPLLFTIGGARSGVSLNPLEPGDAIPLLIYQTIATPYANWQDMAWGASFVLLIIILIVFFGLRKLVKEVRL